ncbi:MAG TPA: hypothetical protein VNA28_13405 [Solirubrobacteraceae bacterium]|nr:hypothetical protein [Solirubrobacteraceae bacterium]
MSDEAATAEAEENTGSTETEKTHEETVAYARFQKVNQQAKEAKQQVAQMSKEMAELRAQMEERETAGLPELERERKRAEQLEKRAAAAEERAEKQEKAALLAGRKSLVLAAAAAAGFDEADDALRYPEHVDLNEIESASDAERAVKRLAKARPKLLKAEESKLPGQVLRNGRAAERGSADPLQEQRENEGQTILEGIRNLQRGWQSGGTL